MSTLDTFHCRILKVSGSNLSWITEISLSYFFHSLDILKYTTLQTRQWIRTVHYFTNNMEGEFADLKNMTRFSIVLEPDSLPCWVGSLVPDYFQCCPTYLQAKPTPKSTKHVPPLRQYVELQTPLDWE